MSLHFWKVPGNGAVNKQRKATSKGGATTVTRTFYAFQTSGSISVCKNLLVFKHQQPISNKTSVDKHCRVKTKNLEFG